MTEETALLQSLGGEAGIRQWVDGFYDRVAADPLLMALFPPNLSQSREKQWAYFVQFFGGTAYYTERYGKPFLRFKHRKIRIGLPERDAWMAHLLDSLRAQYGDEALVSEVERRVRPLADAMVNHQPGKQDTYYFNA